MNLLVVSNRRILNGTYIADQKSLEQGLEILRPDALLFAFWSWKVPDWMLKTYKCYGMHTGFMLDGKGLGGSPIDNLQTLGVEWAALNVFEMTEVIDGGRVRLAIPINLSVSKPVVIEQVDWMIPEVVEFLKQDISKVPERFKRLPNAK